jgi:hypothetical protein
MHSAPLTTPLYLAMPAQGCINTKDFVIPEETKEDGSTFRPEPLVWRYNWSNELQRVVVHYKMGLARVATFDMDERGPWCDAWVDYEDPATGAMRRKRVLRTEPSGVKFLTKIPDLRIDPGFEEYIPDASWQRQEVFRQLSKYKMPQSAQPDAHKVLASLGEWHAMNQRLSELPLFPIRWPASAPHMQGLEMATTIGPWHDLWATLLQFSPRPPPHGPLSASPASAASSAASAIAAATAAAADARSQINPGTSVPRASQVNVVRHTSYTTKDASMAKLLDAGESYVQENINSEGALFWFELEEADGEFSVGLGRRWLEATGARELAALRVGEDMNVAWYQRKSSRHEWGATAAYRYPVVYIRSRQKIRHVSSESTDSVLAFVVDVT